MAIVDAGALGAPNRLILDTAVWIAVTTGGVGTPGLVSPETLLLMETAAHDGRLYVSVATVWEIALLARRGVLDVGDFSEWLADQTRPPGVNILPLSAELAYESSLMPKWTGAAVPLPSQLALSEGMDHLLLATARRMEAVIVTTDPALLASAERGAVRAYDARVTAAERATV